jgi:hypothetical protein
MFFDHLDKKNTMVKSVTHFDNFTKWIFFVVNTKLSSSTKPHFLPCLESLEIDACDGLSEVLDLPPSIKTLEIWWCSNLQTLSGQLDVVQTLRIYQCGSLKSLEPRIAGRALPFWLQKPGVITERSSSILISQASYYQVFSWYKVASLEPTATAGWSQGRGQRTRCPLLPR